MKKGHFPCKKGTFSYHFESWGGHVPPVPPPPPLPTPLVTLGMVSKSSWCKGLHFTQNLRYEIFGTLYQMIQVRLQYFTRVVDSSDMTWTRVLQDSSRKFCDLWLDLLIRLTTCDLTWTRHAWIRMWISKYPTVQQRLEFANLLHTEDKILFWLQVKHK